MPVRVALISKAPVGIFFQALEDELLQTRVEVGREFPRRGRIVGWNCRESGGRARARKRKLARDKEVEHDPERPEVCSSVHFATGSATPACISLLKSLKSSATFGDPKDT